MDHIERTQKVVAREMWRCGLEKKREIVIMRQEGGREKHTRSSTC
jgi:hypothetical protein